MTAERPGALTFAWLGAWLFAASLGVFLYAYLVTFGRQAPDEPALPAILLDVGLFTLFALHHSALARSGAKALIARIVPPELERATYVWAASLLFVGVCLSWRAVPGELYRLTGVLAAVGYLIQFTGVVLTAGGSSAIDVLDLAGVRPVLDVRDGRQAVHVPLETAGLYGFVRHPVYFAWVLFVFGTPHMTMTRFVFAAVSTVYLAVAIPFEERSLIRLFGEEYRHYRRRVRWRMIPGLY
jgi:protein-S-isoprenylcysteine O-methyltransferase Ste14